MEHLSNIRPDFLNAGGYRNVVRMKGGYLNAVKMPGGFLNSVPQEDAPGTGTDNTATEQYKQDIDQYGNAGDQAAYYQSAAYLAYLQETQRLSASAAAAEAARVRNAIQAGLANAAAAAANAATAAEKEAIEKAAIEKARLEAEAKNFTIMGVKVPKVAVYVLGAGAAFLLIRKFFFKK